VAVFCSDIEPVAAAVNSKLYSCVAERDFGETKDARSAVNNICNLAKVRVDGSNPFARSSFCRGFQLLKRTASAVLLLTWNQTGTDVSTAYALYVVEPPRIYTARSCLLVARLQ
jgi:hypothetical protein